MVKKWSKHVLAPDAAFNALDWSSKVTQPESSKTGQSCQLKKWSNNGQIMVKERE